MTMMGRADEAHSPDISTAEALRQITERQDAEIERVLDREAAQQVDTVFVTSDTGGTKGSKLARYGQIPTHPLRLLAEHYGKGNEKYPTDPETGIDNWRNGYDWNLSYDALQRHANAFWGGEDIDPETGSPHLIAVAWHCFTMVEWARNEALTAMYDNRQDPRDVLDDSPHV